MAEAGEEGEGLVDIFGLVAVAVGEGGVEGPAELGVGEHGEEEHADELSVGEPDGLGEVGSLDGEEVDEDGLSALKEDVEGGGVFEYPAVVDEFGGEVEGEFGGAEPEGRWPLPGVGDEWDAGVAESEGCVRIGVWIGEDFGCDEALLLDESGSEGQSEKVVCGLSVGELDGAYDGVGRDFEATCGVAEGGGCGSGGGS